MHETILKYRRTQDTSPDMQLNNFSSPMIQHLITCPSAAINEPNSYFVVLSTHRWSNGIDKLLIIPCTRSTTRHTKIMFYQIFSMYIEGNKPIKHFVDLVEAPPAFASFIYPSNPRKMFPCLGLYPTLYTSSVSICRERLSRFEKYRG